MRTTAKSMKSFYKQKKTNITGGISKSKSTSRKVKPKHATTLTPDVNDGYDKNEEMLKQFDMNIAYGPCLGMRRIDRWERALRLGMNPPNEIEKLLKDEKTQQECLWHGRVSRA